LLLLASLEERSTYRELDYFLGVESKSGLKGDDLADKATKDKFALFWEAAALLTVEVLPCFQK